MTVVEERTEKGCDAPRQGCAPAIAGRPFAAECGGSRRSALPPSSRATGERRPARPAGLPRAPSRARRVGRARSRSRLRASLERSQAPSQRPSSSSRVAPAIDWTLSSPRLWDASLEGCLFTRPPALAEACTASHCTSSISQARPVVSYTRAAGGRTRPPPPACSLRYPLRRSTHTNPPPPRPSNLPPSTRQTLPAVPRCITTHGPLRASPFPDIQGLVPDEARGRGKRRTGPLQRLVPAAVNFLSHGGERRGRGRVTFEPGGRERGLG